MTLYGLRRAMTRADFQDARVWIDPNMLRVDQGHHLTRDLELRLFPGKDIYALGSNRAEGASSA